MERIPRGAGKKQMNKQRGYVHTYVSCHTIAYPKLCQRPIWGASGQHIYHNIIYVLNHHKIYITIFVWRLILSTVSPYMASICLCTNWTLGGVKDRYIKYEKSGDNVFGAAVTGLPILKIVRNVLSLL